MKFIYALLVIFLQFILPTIELTDIKCPIGKALVSRESSSLVECYKLSKGCPSPYYCSGGVFTKGVCCKDPRPLLCLTCFGVDDVHWDDDDTGTIFYVNIFFRWEREECSKSAVYYGWDPSLTVLVTGDDNQTRLERTLNCKATEKPCSKYYELKVQLKSFRALYRVNAPGPSSLCRFIEIAHVLPPLPPPSLPVPLPRPVLDATDRPLLSSSVEAIASILGALCLVATATAVLFVYRWRFGQSARNHESEIALMQECVDIFIVAMPGIGSALIRELRQINGLNCVTTDQCLAEIFQNSKEWMDSVQLKHTDFLFLLTESLISDEEDNSHPMNSITKSLFHDVQNSPRVKNMNTFYVYLQPPSKLEGYFKNYHKRKNSYNLAEGNFRKKDFHRLVSDLKAIHSDV